MKNPILATCVLLSSSLIFGGCAALNEDFIQTQSTMANVLDAKITKEQQITVGPFLLFFVRSLISLSPDGEEDAKLAKGLVKSIRKVQIGVYNVHGKNLSQNRPDILRRIHEAMEKDGWEAIVRHTDNGSLAGIYIGYDKANHLNRMFIVSLEGKELSMVHLKGRLEQLAEIAMRDGGLNIDV